MLKKSKQPLQSSQILDKHVTHADKECTSLQDPLLVIKIKINIAATNEDIPEIEQTICTVNKERNHFTVL